MTHAEQSLIQRKAEWLAEWRWLTREKQRIAARIAELDEILKVFAK